jgi:ferredoxin
MSEVHIKIDYNKCVGSTICVMDLPDVFSLNEDAQSQVLDPAAASRQKIIDAAGACPMSAISVFDTETGERLFPQR